MTDPNPKLLTEPVSPKAFIEQTFLDVAVREGIFPAGAFSLALPKQWLPEMAGSDVVPDVDRPVVTLALFTPGTPEAHGAAIDARVTVRAGYLPREINGADWVRQWCFSQGLDILDMRELPTPLGMMGDVLARGRDSGRLRRMMTVKDGDLVYLIDGSVLPPGDPSDPVLQEIGLMAIMRFKLLAPSGQQFAERMEPREFGSDAGRATLLAPGSWDSVPPGDAPPGGALLHLNNRVGDSVGGSLVVAFGLPDSTPEALEDTFVGKLSAQGFSFADADPHLQGTRGTLTFAVATRKGQGPIGEVRLLCLRARGAGLPLSLAVLSPAPDVAFEAWAINRRAFEIAMQTLNMESG